MSVGRRPGRRQRRVRQLRRHAAGQPRRAPGVSRILAHALHEAAERGQITTSLQASKLGQGIYARLGYQPLGEIHLYERRP